MINIDDRKLIVLTKSSLTGESVMIILFIATLSWSRPMALTVTNTMLLVIQSGTSGINDICLRDDELILFRSSAIECIPRSCRILRMWLRSRGFWRRASKWWKWVTQLLLELWESLERGHRMDHVRDTSLARRLPPPNTKSRYAGWQLSG